MDKPLVEDIAADPTVIGYATTTVPLQLSISAIDGALARFDNISYVVLELAQFSSILYKSCHSTSNLENVNISRQIQ